MASVYLKHGTSILILQAPSGAATVTSAVLANLSASATPATTFLTLGHAFVKGDVPSSKSLGATWTPSGGSAQSVTVQVSGQRTWSDGSLAFARVGLALPSLTGSAHGTLTLNTTSGAQNTTLPGGKTVAQVLTDLQTNFAFTVTANNLYKGRETVTVTAGGSGFVANAGTSGLAAAGLWVDYTGGTQVGGGAAPAATGGAWTNSSGVVNYLWMNQPSSFRYASAPTLTVNPNKDANGNAVTGTYTVSQPTATYTLPAIEGSGSWTWTANTWLSTYGSTVTQGTISGRVQCELLDSGPLFCTFTCWGPFADNTGGALHPQLIVRAFYRCWLNQSTGAIDRVEYFHKLQQGWIEDLAGGSTLSDLEVGDFAVVLNGVGVSGRSWTRINIPHHTSHALTAIDGNSENWSTGGSDWTSNAPTLLAQFSNTYLRKSGILPAYDLEYYNYDPTVYPQTATKALSPSTDTDTSVYIYNPGARKAGRMGDAGSQAPGTSQFSSGSMAINKGSESDHIGILPHWTVRALLSQEHGYLRSDLATALYAGHMPCRVMNPQTGRISTILPAQGDGLASLTISNAGSGGTPGTYNLTFSGGGGSSAAGTYTIGAGGTITAVNLTGIGNGYTSNPTVGTPSGGITGAVITATAGNTIFADQANSGLGTSRSGIGAHGQPSTGGINYNTPQSASSNIKLQLGLSNVAFSGSGTGDVSNTEGGWYSSGDGWGASHFPSLVYYSYLRTGAPWLLEDLLVHANQMIVANAVSTNPYNSTQPTSNFSARTLGMDDGTTLYGRFIIGLGTAEVRFEAWAWKLLVQALAVCPDSRVEQPYLRKIYDLNAAAAVTKINAGSTNFKALGTWSFPIPGYITGGNWTKASAYAETFEQKYQFLARAFEYGAMEQPANTLTFLQHHLKQMKAWAGGDPSLPTTFLSGAYYMPISIPGGDYYSSWGSVLWWASANGTASFSSDGWVTAPVTGATNETSYPLANGDRVAFYYATVFVTNTSPTIPAEVTPGQVYYITQLDTVNKKYRLSPNADQSSPILTYSSTPTGVPVGYGLGYYPSNDPPGVDNLASAWVLRQANGDVGSADAYVAALHGIVQVAIRLGLASATDSWVTTFLGTDGNGGFVNDARVAKNWATGSTDWVNGPKYRFGRTV